MLNFNFHIHISSNWERSSIAICSQHITIIHDEDFICSFGESQLLISRLWSINSVKIIYINIIYKLNSWRFMMFISKYEIPILSNSLNVWCFFTCEFWIEILWWDKWYDNVQHFYKHFKQKWKMIKKTKTCSMDYLRISQIESKYTCTYITFHLILSCSLCNKKYIICLLVTTSTFCLKFNLLVE